MSRLATSQPSAPVPGSAQVASQLPSQGLANGQAEAGVGRSAHLDASLDKAHKLAVSQRQDAVTSEHLLFALTEDPEALVVLSASTVDIDRLRSDIGTHLGQLPDNEPPDKPILPSADLLKVLKLAAMAAQQSARRQIDGAIVLAAIIGDASTPSAGLLRAHGLTFNEVIRVLQKTASAASVAVPTAAHAAAVLPAASPTATVAPAASPTAAEPPALSPPTHAAASVPPPPEIKPGAVQPADPATPDRLAAAAAAARAVALDLAAASTAAASAGAATVVLAPVSMEPTTEELLANVRSRLQETAPRTARRVAPGSAAASAPEAVAAPPPSAAERAGIAVASPSATLATSPAAASPPLPEQSSPVDGEPVEPHAPVPAIDPPTVALTNGKAPVAAHTEPRATMPPIGPPVVPPPPSGPRATSDPRPAPSLGTPSQQVGPQPPRRLPSIGPSVAPSLAQALQQAPSLAPGLAPSLPPVAAARPLQPAPQPPLSRAIPAAPAPLPSQVGMARPPYPIPPIPAPMVDMRALAAALPRRMRQDESVVVEVTVPRRSLEIPLVAGHRWPPLRVATMRLRGAQEGVHVELLSPETLWISPPRVHQGADDAAWRWRVTPRVAGTVKIALAGATRIVGGEGISGEAPLGEENVEIAVKRRRSRRGFVGLLLVGNLIGLVGLALASSGRAPAILGALWAALRGLLGMG